MWSLASAVLGASCAAVRAIVFDKTPTANWKVSWHQDLNYWGLDGDQLAGDRAPAGSCLGLTPKVRLNMGKPVEGDAPFGYVGMSLQSDRHLFIDVNKVTLYQSGTSAIGSSPRNRTRSDSPAAATFTCSASAKAR